LICTKFIADYAIPDTSASFFTLLADPSLQDRVNQLKVALALDPGIHQASPSNALDTLALDLHKSPMACDVYQEYVGLLQDHQNKDREILLSTQMQIIGLLNNKLQTSLAIRDLNILSCLAAPVLRHMDPSELDSTSLTKSRVLEMGYYQGLLGTHKYILAKLMMEEGKEVWARCEHRGNRYPSITELNRPSARFSIIISYHKSSIKSPGKGEPYDSCSFRELQLTQVLDMLKALPFSISTYNNWFDSQSSDEVQQTGRLLYFLIP